MNLRELREGIDHHHKQWLGSILKLQPQKDGIDLFDDDVGVEGRMKLEELAKKYGLEGAFYGDKQAKKPAEGVAAVQILGRRDSVEPSLKEGPGGYMHRADALTLSPFSGVDSRPFLGAGSSYGIKE